jgi:hypothetical protein
MAQFYVTIISFFFILARILGIRGFHEFDAISTHKIICRTVSSSVNSKLFHFKFNYDVHAPIKRLLDDKDFHKGTFLIIEHNDIVHFAQIISTDLQKGQLTISLFLPALPSKKVSTSRSAPLVIQTTDVVGSLVNAPTKTTSNDVLLTDDQFLGIENLCEEL